MATSTPIRVLILEDNTFDAELMVDALKQADLDPRWIRVDTEADFVAQLDTDLDLILSDYTLPQLTGLDALRLVRARGLEVPFILVSGSIGEDLAVAAMRSGADDYLLKDRTARLGSAALRAIDKRRLSMEAARNEAARRESDERFRQIAESIREVFWLSDLETGRLLYVSPGYEQVWGRSREALYAAPQTWLEAVHPDDRDRVARIIFGADIEDEHSQEYRIVRPDGSQRWIHDRAFPVRNAAGEIYRVAGIADDISDRKLADLKIRNLDRIHAILSGVNALIVRVQDSQALFEEACRIAAGDGEFALAWIGVIDPDSRAIVPVARAGPGASEFLARTPTDASAPYPEMILLRAIRECRAVFCNDITLDADVGGPLRLAAIRAGYRSCIVLPLVTEGEVAGVFSMLANACDQFDDEEVGLLTELAGNIALALEHMARQAKIEKLSRVRALSGEINAAIIRIEDRESLLQATCRIAAEHGKFDLVWIGEIDTDAQHVHPIASVGFSRATAHAVNWAGIEASGGAFGEAVRTQRAAVRNNIEANISQGNLRKEALLAGCLSTVAIPLIVDNKVVALIALFAKGRDFFDTDELALLNALADDISFALQSLAQRAKVEYLSNYDPLTGLPNRSLLMDRVAQNMRARDGEQSHLSLIVFTIERFRSINETFGRRGGDALLRAIARRLETIHHSKDTIARIGADAFAVFVRSVRDSLPLMHIVESHVLSCFREPFVIDDREIIVAVKCGVAIFPLDADNAERLFINAESALTEAKASTEQCMYYARNMNAEVAKFLLLETKLRKAVDAKQFVLHYQPKILLANGRLCGLEALIRWQDPESGLISPGVFIPLLEQTGLIEEVGKWAIRQALADHRAWTARGLVPPRVAVNVSAVQLGKRNFVDFVSNVINEAGNDANALELEVTESLLIDVQSSTRTLFVLRGLGVHITMDDFGTGYSSLSYLTQLPVSAVKIDRTFINAMTTSRQDLSIVTTILALARALQLHVIAEGVETREQLGRLQQLGCDEAQGYLFSRPVPADDIVQLLRYAVPGVPWPGFAWSGAQGRRA